MLVANTKNFTEEQLSRLREQVGSGMSEKRFRHTLGVEQMVIRLAGLYCPEKESVLRAAALLHDLTKEKETGEQLALCQKYGLTVLPTDLAAPKTFHARTAAAEIPERFPEYADEEVISCVRWHTTGRAGMTLTEKLVYLADYIDETRSFEDCVLLRRFFFGASPETATQSVRRKLLKETLIYSYDLTIRALLQEGTPISSDTIEARNDLIVSG